MKHAFATLILLALTACHPGLSGASSGYPLEMVVLVDGRPCQIYPWEGRSYIEAHRGQEYAIRLSNRSGDRIAVALAVDGLNTIDARHTSPQEARKWVLDPWQTVTISGWQVNSEQARRFFFTTESRSYGAALGQTANLGNIAAAVFREVKPAPVVQLQSSPCPPHPSARGACRDAAAQPSAPRPGCDSESAAEKSCRREEAKKEYAATGMGDRLTHRVNRIHLELESNPCQVFLLRYEFREALVRLGVLRPDRTPLHRRENASGFDAYCPER